MKFTTVDFLYLSVKIHNMKSLLSPTVIFWLLLRYASAQEMQRITNSFPENTKTRATLVFKKDFRTLKGVRSSKLTITALGFYEITTPINESNNMN